MKKRMLILWATALWFFAAAAGAQTFDLSAVKAWAGSGSNSAVFIIDWHDGLTPSALAWGYKWDGTATVYEMMQAIDALDTSLSISAHPLYPETVYSIFYDLNHNGSTFTLGLPFNMGGSENGSASDSGDHYTEGWFTGFWGLLNGSGNPYNGGSWLMSDVGAASDTLSNGGFYAFSFTRDTINYNIPDAGVPVAALLVPEPSSGILMAVGVAGCALWLRRRST